MADIDKLREDIVFSERLRGRETHFHTTWGLFNPRRVDEGSRLLVEHLQVGEADTCLDLGCGYGPIGLTLARLCPQGWVHMVDKDFVAVDYARKNALLNRVENCQIYLSNAFSHVPEQTSFNAIASNLPAKVGNELLTLIMHEARARLHPGGRFYVVTISGLRDFIKRHFRELFGNYEKVKQGRTYTVSLAIKE